jgi:hypothetical protein
MSIAENIMLGVIRQMGVTPEQVIALIQNVSGAVVMVREIHAEMAVLKAERAAFHQGAEFVVNDFRARLSRVENLLATLEGNIHGTVNGHTINGLAVAGTGGNERTSHGFDRGAGGRGSGPDGSGIEHDAGAAIAGSDTATD